jgi:hypothetical protein
MWSCPKCRAKVDDSFEVCWSCGTSAEGEEDPAFVRADDAGPIDDPPVEPPLQPGLGLDDELPGPPPELVECYATTDPAAAKLLADHLTNQGIPAVIGGELYMIGRAPLEGASVSVRAEDLPRALPLITAQAQRRARRADRSRPLAEFPWDVFAMTGMFLLMLCALTGFEIGGAVDRAMGWVWAGRAAGTGLGLGMWLVAVLRLYRSWEDTHPEMKLRTRLRRGTGAVPLATSSSRGSTPPVIATVATHRPDPLG